ncbi:hypothetical protein Cri9333_0685 [Crinalium epipsammum PCC 9333]|uniref:Uncharacterized protein n=1 Tax=Crinalium epipsammum PCC 9333 TaxID=1173022 RepID=K9VVN4_9CYAN|nr:hypothetical protein [Crinalium epipsammum]AFZ11619.1 hypothetical protein Cri9333_0685 [Crinalium epipsammum PCC 9333]
MFNSFGINQQPENQSFQVRLSPFGHDDVFKDFDNLEDAVQYANQWLKDFDDPHYQNKLLEIDSIIIIDLLTSDLVDIVEIPYKNVGKVDKNKPSRIQGLKVNAEKYKQLGLTLSESNDHQISVFYVKAKGKKIGNLIWFFSGWMLERTSEEFDIYFPTYWDEMKKAIGGLANICGMDED